MPTARVHFPDGTEWLVTHCEVVLTERAIAQLSAEEIGTRVLALLPRIKRLTPHAWEWPSGDVTLDEVEAHLLTDDAGNAHER